MSFRCRTMLALSVAASQFVSSGCKRAQPPPAEPIPTENMTVVVADPGPGLRKPDAHQHSDRTARKGDVLFLVKASQTVEWSDELEGDRLTRSGPMLEVKRLPLEASLFVWASDVKREVPVATATYLCSAIHQGAPSGQSCEQSLLRRWLADGTTVGFVRCAERSCPVVLAGPKGTGKTRIEGLDDLRVARIGSRDLLIASTHSSDKTKTGQAVVVIAADPGLKQIGIIPYVEADPSNPDVLRWQIGTWKLQPDGIRVQGERAVVERATDKRLETALINDLWVLTPQATLERRAAPPAASP